MSRKKLLALHFSGIGCITFGDSSFIKTFSYHVTCPVSCPVASSSALALPAVALAPPAVLLYTAAAGHVSACSLSPDSFKLRRTTAAAAGHFTACSLSPESFRLFLFFSLATFSLFSLATSATATRSLRQSGCNLSRQEENCCATSNSYSHHSTKQYKRHVATEAQAKTLEEAQ